MTTSAISFPLFVLLPIELRLQIYNVFLSHSRIIHLYTLDHPSNIFYDNSLHPSLTDINLKISDVTWTTHTPLPALLSVSRETRAVALSHYNLQLARPKGREIIYMNPKLDIVFAHMEKWPVMLKTLLGDMRASDVAHNGRGIRRLVVSTNTWGEWFNAGAVSRRRVKMIEGLEEVIVVTRGRIWDENLGEGLRDGGVLVVPGSNEEMENWESEVLGGWRALKVDGLADGVRLRMLAWKREGG